MARIFFRNIYESTNKVSALKRNMYKTFQQIAIWRNDIYNVTNMTKHDTRKRICLKT